MAPKNPFAGFSHPMLEKFNVTMKDIDDQRRLDPERTSWIITTVDGDPMRNSSTRFEVLSFLKKIGAIKNFGKSFSEYSGFRVDAARAAFEACASQLKSAMKKSENPLSETAQKSPPSEETGQNRNQVLYRVTYTTADEILINGFLLSRAQADKENAEVFRYLYAHPNKTISKEELNREIGKKKSRGQKVTFSVGKDLRKIVENLRFTGTLQKMFFRIVTDRKKNIETIFFRNPVTKDDWLQLELPRPSLYRKTE